MIKPTKKCARSSIALEQSPVVKRATRPGFRRILGIAVQMMQQLTGINIICYYLPYVLTESVGLDGTTARLLAAINALTYLFSTFIGLGFIERWGRRRLMMYGALGQCCCWLAITILLRYASNADPFSTRQRQLASVSVLFFFVFNCFFGATWQGVSWLYPTEINSTQNRIAGMAYGVATNWLINFGVVFITPLGIRELDWQFYVIWTVLNGLIVLVIYLFYPETAGRSLEDIDGMFEAHSTIWVFMNRSMTARKPSTSRGNQDSGDDVPSVPSEGHITVSSRNVSGIELSSLAQLRHRQASRPSTPLGAMTPTEHATTLGSNTTLINHAGGGVDEIGSGAEAVEGDEDADGISLRVVNGAAVLSGQAPHLMSQISSKALL